MATKAKKPKPTNQKWGWTSYKRLPLRRDDGRKLYRARFQSDGLTSYTVVTIQFWARHPTAALNGIANSGYDPLTYHEWVIN